MTTARKVLRKEMGCARVVDDDDGVVSGTSVAVTGFTLSLWAVRFSRQLAGATKANGRNDLWYPPLLIAPVPSLLKFFSNRKIIQPPPREMAPVGCFSNHGPKDNTKNTAFGPSAGNRYWTRIGKRRCYVLLKSYHVHQSPQLTFMHQIHFCDTILHNAPFPLLFDDECCCRRVGLMVISLSKSRPFSCNKKSFGWRRLAFLSYAFRSWHIDHSVFFKWRGRYCMCWKGDPIKQGDRIIWQFCPDNPELWWAYEPPEEVGFDWNVQ